MMNLRIKPEEIVGSPYCFALFYNFAGGLRFELSEGNGGSPLYEVLTALRKATAICDDVFGNEDKILAHCRLLPQRPVSGCER